MRKAWLFPAALAALVSLGGCASMRSLDSDVTTYSQWPAGRKPMSYVFERLPSQQIHPQQQQLLEDSARQAIEAAGFVPAQDIKTADVSIQLGARITATDRSPFDDPFWYGGFRYGGGFGYGLRGRYWGSGYGWGFPYGYGYGYGRYEWPTYEREVGLLIRDKQTGQPLYEASANNNGMSSAAPLLLPAMFAAALKDFPNGGSTPHRVNIPLATTPQ